MAETSKTPSIRETMQLLDEASLKDVAASVGNKLKAAAGDKKAEGTEEAKRLQKHLKKLYSKWLGQTGEEATEETLMKFLVSKVGFTAGNARKIFDKSGVQDPTKSESVMEDLKRVDIDKVLMNAAQFAFAHDLISDPDEKDQIKRNDSRGGSDSSFGSSTRRSGSRYNRDDNDLLRGIRPKDKEEQEDAAAKLNQTVRQYAEAAELDEQHLVELAEIVKATKGVYGKLKDIKEPEAREDAYEMLSRIGFAYIRSQIKN